MSHQPQPELQAPTHVGWLLGFAVAVAAYVVWQAFELPALAYLPEVGRWATEVPEGHIGMRYYGWLLVGLAGLGVGLGLGRTGLVKRVLAHGPGARWLARIVVLEALGGLGYLAYAELTHWLA